MGDRSGSTGDLSARSDYGLVLKIMQAVEHYNRDQRINADPLSLRDTMLAVAALLHMEAIKMDGGNQLAAAADGERLRQMFAIAARCQLDAAVEAAASISRNQSTSYQ